MKKLILALIFVASITYGNVPNSATSTATGGGGAAAVEAGEASFMNPASITHLKGRYLYSSFQKDLLALSLTQNDKQSVVPGAISYFADKEVQMFSLSLADFMFENISFGVSATYWQAEFESQDRRETTFNGNVGVIWTPIKNLGLGFAAENVLSPPDVFKLNDRLAPSSRFGLNYLYSEWFRWRLDFVTLRNNQWDDWTPQTGVESYVGKWFVLRTGVSRPTGLKESWSAGFGFDLPRFKVDYASQWHVDGGDDQRHSVDLEIPF